MSKRSLYPNEGELEMVDRIAALVTQRVMSQQNELKGSVYRKQTHQENIFTTTSILPADHKSERIINNAEYREREGLKKRIAKIAVSLGCRVGFARGVEAETEIDVVLERFGLKIACFTFNCGKLSCDAKSVRECIQSNFNHILVCTPARIENELFQKILGNLVNKVSIIAIDRLSEFLKSISLPNIKTEMNLKNRKVVTEYNRLTENESDLRSNAIVRVLSNSKMKKGA